MKTDMAFCQFFDGDCEADTLQMFGGHGVKESSCFPGQVQPLGERRQQYGWAGFVQEKPGGCRNKGKQATGHGSQAALKTATSRPQGLATTLIQNGRVRIAQV